MMRLHDYVLSGNCYKLRLFLRLLDLPCELVAVDFYPGRAHRRPEFRALHPLQQIPVLQDGDLVLWDSGAILVYLASRYDTSQHWYPADAELRGQVAQWLAFAEGLTASLSSARLHDGLLYELDADTCRRAAHRLLRVLDEHLWFAEQSGQSWLATAGRPSIADIACFPYVALSSEGGVYLEDYPAVRRWLDRVRGLPRFIGMPGIFVGP